MGCSASSNQTSYYTSVDIPSRWMPTDTLCIPLEVARTPRVGALQLGADYSCSLGARYTSTFPYRTLALSAELRYTDALGTEYRVKRTTLELPLTDDDGVWLGGSWGSLIQREGKLPTCFSFPYEGSYRLLLIPAYGDSVAVAGLNNLSFNLTPNKR
jgi:gliding motility-associated lipoprotein GldH